MIARLSCEAVAAINVALTGKEHRLLDLGKLEAAVEQPFVTFGGADLHGTLHMKAAVLARGLVAGHPFMDGNKRTALLACLQMLRLNGSEVDRARMTRTEAGEMTLGLAVGTVTVEVFAKWLVNPA